MEIKRALEAKVLGVHHVLEARSDSIGRLGSDQLLLILLEQCNDVAKNNSPAIMPVAEWILQDEVISQRQNNPPIRDEPDQQVVYPLVSN